MRPGCISAAVLQGWHSAVQCFTGSHQGTLVCLCVAHVKWGENTQRDCSSFIQCHDLQFICVLPLSVIYRALVVAG